MNLLTFVTALKLGKIDNYELTHGITESYSEPHATQIALMKSSGFKNIDDSIEVSNLIEVPLFDCNKTFSDYITTFDLFIKKIPELQVPVVANHYFQNNFNYNLYYIGALIFGRRYVSNFKDNLSEYPPLIKNSYENIIQAVCDEDCLKCYNYVEELRKAY